jgi:hypothetical protein
MLPQVQRSKPPSQFITTKRIVQMRFLFPASAYRLHSHFIRASTFSQAAAYNQHLVSSVWSLHAQFPPSGRTPHSKGPTKYSDNDDAAQTSFHPSESEPTQVLESHFSSRDLFLVAKYALSAWISAVMTVFCTTCFGYCFAALPDSIIPMPRYWYS